MDLLLYDRYLHHKSVKAPFTHHTPKSVLTCCKAELVCFFVCLFFVFFYLGFLSPIFTIHMTVGKGGGYPIIYFLPTPLLPILTIISTLISESLLGNTPLTMSIFEKCLGTFSS